MIASEPLEDQMHIYVTFWAWKRWPTVKLFLYHEDSETLNFILGFSCLCTDGYSWKETDFFPILIYFRSVCWEIALQVMSRKSLCTNLTVQHNKAQGCVRRNKVMFNSTMTVTCLTWRLAFESRSSGVIHDWPGVQNASTEPNKISRN